MSIIYDGFLIGVKIAVAMLSCALVLVLVLALIAGIASACKRGDHDE